MPVDLDERRKRCVKWITRTSPTASPHASDDDEDGDDLSQLICPHLSDDDHSMGSPTDFPHESDIDNWLRDGNDEVVNETDVSARDFAAASLIGFASNFEVERENQHRAREDAAASLFGFSRNEC